MVGRDGLRSSLTAPLFCYSTIFTPMPPGVPDSPLPGCGGHAPPPPPPPRRPTYRLFHSTWYVAPPGEPGSGSQLRRTWKFCASSLMPRGGSGVPGEGGSRGASGGIAMLCRGPLLGRSPLGRAARVSLLGISRVGSPPPYTPQLQSCTGKPRLPARLRQALAARATLSTRIPGISCAPWSILSAVPRKAPTP